MKEILKPRFGNWKNQPEINMFWLDGNLIYKYARCVRINLYILSYENNIEVSLNFGWFSYPTKSGKDNKSKNCTPRN